MDGPGAEELDVRQDVEGRRPGVEHDDLASVVVPNEHGEVRDRHRAAPKVLEDDDRAASAQLVLRAIEGALERLGTEAPSPRLELELEVEHAAGRWQVERPADVIGIGGGPPVPQDHRERGGPALVRLLRNERHGGDEVTLPRGDVSADSVQ